MKVRAKKTSYMDGVNGSKWITKDKQYELVISKCMIIDDDGDKHLISASEINNYFDIVEK